MTQGRMETGTSGARADRSPVRTAATVVGAVCWSASSASSRGATSQYDQMGFAGHGSMALLLGLFQVSVLHNIVHLLYGVAGLAVSRQARTATAYLIGGGAIYLVLWLYGLVIDKQSGANFVPLNSADDWLHFGLGVGMIALGYLLGRRARTVATQR